MTPTKSLGIFTAVLALAAALALPTKPARACCAAGPPNSGVRIASQDVLVIWNPDTKTEHFIRRADFLGPSADFGFLVPTPSEPRLEEADGRLLDRLEEVTRPKVRTVVDWKIQPLSCCLLPFTASLGMKKGSFAGGADAVRLLQEVQIAGLDAVVLEADDATAMTGWLEARGYKLRDAITDWVKPYIARRWKITAFKYSSKEAGELAKTAAVRMSFKTDRPLFPYRVPKDNLANPQIGPKDRSLLRVHFMGPERVAGVLGEKGEDWGAELKYAGPRDDLSVLLGPSDTVQWPKKGWLTTFDDAGWPGSDEHDLFFEKAKSQEPFHKVIVETEERSIPLPIELPILAGLLIAGLWWRKRRARAKA